MRLSHISFSRKGTRVSVRKVQKHVISNAMNPVKVCDYHAAGIHKKNRPSWILIVFC